MITDSQRAAAEWLALFSEPTRFALLQLLAGGERAVAELARATGAEAANLARHLALLKAAGLVALERRGLYSCYRLVGATVDDGAIRFAHPSGLTLIVPLGVSPDGGER